MLFIVYELLKLVSFCVHDHLNYCNTVHVFHPVTQNAQPCVGCEYLCRFNNTCNLISVLQDKLSHLNCLIRVVQMTF